MKPIFLFASLFLTLSTAAAGASDIGPLLKKLEEKGLLSAEESAALSAPAARNRSKLELSADLRLRYQYSDNSSSAHSRPSGRYSLRLGAEAGAGRDVTLALGLASGSDSGARSLNQTLGRNLEKKNLYVHYTYADFTAADWLLLRGGRMKSVLWDPTDMVWDSDLKPEGVAASARLRAGTAELFSGAGFAVLGESSGDASDPYLFFAQQGIAGQRSGGKFSYKAAVAYYAFGNVKGGAELAGRPSAAEGYLKSNATSGGSYSRDYDACHASFEAGYAPSRPLLPGLVFVSAFGEYIKNTTLDRDSAGWIAGFRAGHRKVESAWQWQLVWSLRRLEAEAWLDTYPDSDFYGGSTGAGGAELSLSLGLGPAVLGLDYYSARALSGGGEKLLQADLTFRL